MPAHQRLDYGSLGEAQRTPQGGLAIPAHLTRAGVFTYIRDGQPVREWRPLAEVSRPATLDSLRNAPLTVGHPREQVVRPENFKAASVGHVGADVRMDNDKTAATVYVQSVDGLKAIERGWRDVSCGYNCDTDNTPGIVPAGEPDAGKSYDRVQRNIVYNHNAIVPAGRAGTARLHLDAADNSVTDAEDPMKIEIIGGVEYEVGTAPHADARSRQDAADKATAAEVQRLRTDAAEAKGKLDAATARLATLDAAEKQRADAAERDALVAKGVIVLGKEWKADGLSTEQITTAIVGKQFPTIRLDAIAESERAVYVRGLLAGIVAPAAAAVPAKRPAAQPVPFHTDAAQPAGSLITQVRNDNMEEGDGMCRMPMAISKNKIVAPLQSTMIENQR